MAKEVIIMITKHIKHYLNEAGQTYFSQWINELKQARLQTPGFKDILVGQQKGDHLTTHLILIFEDEQGLENWNNNQAHTHLLASLQPYLKKASEIEFFTLESMVE